MADSTAEDRAGIGEAITRRVFIVRRIIEFVLAMGLLIAAGLKGYQLLSYSANTFPGLLHSRELLAGLVQFELLLAFWLLVGGFSRARFVAAVACFSLFAAVASYEAFRGLPSCGCFGDSNVPPGITAGFDAGAVAALWLTRAKTITSNSVPRWRLLLIAALGVLLSGSFWTMFLLRAKSAAGAASGLNDLVVLDPHSWVNRPFPLFDDIDGGNQLRGDRWILVFYHFDCESCLRAIPFYAAVAGSPNNPRVAFIAMPPLAPWGQDPVSVSSNYFRLVLRPDHDWFATTPVVAAIEDGTVLWSDEGENAVHPPGIFRWR